MSKLKVLDLFSGIGGFSLGLERAGMETVAFCEIEEYPRKVLKKHWPDVPIYEDVRKLDGKQYRGTVDVVCGGFPCQPFSVAGKQRGKEDDRHLWPEMLRIIREVKPNWIIGENVAGFITMALDDVLSDLEGEGYTCQAFVIPACAVNAIHRRARVWIVAYSNELTNGKQYKHEKTRNDSKGKVHAVSNTKGEPSNGCKFGERLRTESRNEQSGSCDSKNIPADASSIGQSRQGSHGEQVHTAASRDRKAGNAEPGSKGFIGIPTEPPVRHRNDGLPESMARLKALGNAVVPQIPELIGRAIIQCVK